YELANEVTAYVLNQWIAQKPNTQVKFLEPAIGTGVFYSALRSQLQEGMLSDALGIELDKSFFDASKELWHDEPIRIIHEDSTKVKLDESFNLMITNPPYVRHHHIDKVN